MKYLLVLALLSCQAMTPDEIRVGMDQTGAEVDGQGEADATTLRLTTVYRPKPFRREIIERRVEGSPGPQGRCSEETHMEALSLLSETRQALEEAEKALASRPGVDESFHLEQWLGEGGLALLLSILGYQQYRKRKPNAS